MIIYVYNLNYYIQSYLQLKYGLSNDTSYVIKKLRINIHLKFTLCDTATRQIQDSEIKFQKGKPIQQDFV